MKKIIFLICLISSIFCFPQNIKDQSNPNLNFQDFLKGVKYAFVALDDQEQAKVDELNYSSPYIYYTLEKYLVEIGFEYVFLTSKDKNIMNSLLSLCEVTNIEMYWNITQNLELSEVSLIFTSCNRDEFNLRSSNKIENKNQDEALINLKKE